MGRESVIRAEGLTKAYPASQLNSVRSVLLREAASTWLTQTVLGVFGREKSAEEQVTIKAIDNVSFEIAEGETVGIVGRNGSGKSTLLRVLSRVTTPTKGKAYVQGKIASVLKIGTGFHRELTGRENIYLNAAVHGMGRKETRSKFESVVEFSEMQNFLDTPIKWYSSGMYVRLAFAIAVHLDPDIILIDEALSVGDIEFQKKCRTRIQEITRGAGRTLLIVSHDVSVLESLTERCMVLDSGRLCADGRTSEVLGKYGLISKADSHF